MLNAGSSSIKFSLLAIDDTLLKLIVHEQIESLNEDPHFYIKDSSNVKLHDEYYLAASNDLISAHTQALTKIIQWLDSTKYTLALFNRFKGIERG